MLYEWEVKKKFRVERDLRVLEARDLVMQLNNALDVLYSNEAIAGTIEADNIKNATTEIRSLSEQLINDNLGLFD